MSGNLDQRIVEMEFQNGQFEKGVHTSIESLEALKKSLDFNGAERGLDNLEKSTRHFSMDGLTGAIEAVSGKFSAMEIVGITALQRIANKAMDAGERLIKSLSVDQITSGFSKYTDKTKSVNTIMNATGEDIDYVNERLEKLNWFTDETSYNFTDMVSNIGKFTSAGVKLDDATTAMMGIATEAALSGQGINEASRAMYNFAQAIGAGQVKLMDWRSIENANMGTQEFKQTIIDTAVELGTLKKSEKGVIKTTKGTEVNFKNFNETLSQNWFTSEVLIESLRKYGAYAEEVYKVATRDGITAAEAMENMGDAGMELGAKAFKAAQVARTFTDAIEATKDAVSSGWMRSFELIFGDVNESAELWTDVTNALWEVFAGGAESRNEVLKAWHDASEGGRADMLSGLYDSFEALWNIITAVKEALADIFPIDFGQKLKDFTTNVKDFGENLKKTFGIETKVVKKANKELKRAVGLGEEVNEKTLPDLASEFDGVLKKGSNGEGVKAMQKRLESLGYDLGTAGVDGIFGPRTEEALKKFQEEYGKTVDGVYSKSTHMDLMGALLGPVEEDRSSDIVEEELSPALEKIQELAKGIGSIAKIFGGALKFLGDSFSYILEIVSPVTGAFADFGVTIAKCFTSLSESIDENDTFGQWLLNVKEYLEPVKQWFENFGKNLREFLGLDKNIETFDELIAHFQEQFSKFLENHPEIEKAWGIIGPILKIGADALQSLGKTISTFFSFNGNENGNGFGDFIYNIFGSILDAAQNIDWASVLSIAVVIRGIVDAIKAIKFPAKVVGNIASLPGKLVATLDSFKEAADRFGSGKDSVGGTILKIAVSLALIAGSINAISKIPAGQAWNAVAVLTVMAGVLVGVVVAMQKLAKIDSKQFGARQLSLTVGLVAIAVAVRILASSLKALQGMSMGDISKGALGILAVLTMIAGYQKLMESVKPSGKATFNLIGIAIGLILLMAPLKRLASMDMSGIAKGSLGILAVLTMIAGYQKLMESVKPSGKATFNLIGIAVGLLLLMKPIQTLSKMSFTDIAKSSVGILAVLTMIAGYQKLMESVSTSAGSALGLIGIAVGIKILIQSIIPLTQYNLSKIGTALIGFSGVLLAVAGFSKIMSSINLNFMQLVGLLGLASVVSLLMTSFASLTNYDMNQMKTALLGFSGVLLATAGFSKLTSSSGIDLKTVLSLTLLSVAIKILASAFNSVKDLDPGVMLSFSASIAIMLAALTGAVVLAKSLGGGVGGMASGAAGIGAAFAIIAAIATAVVAGLGLINDATNGGLVDTIVSGGKVLSALTDALTPFDGILGDALLYAGMIAGTAVGAVFGPAVIGGAASISLALGAVVGIATAVVAGLGLLNSIPGAEGALVETINSGGDVLAALGGAFASFGHGFIDVVNGDITDFAESIKTVREALDGIAKDTNAEEGGTLISDIEAALGVVTEIRDYLATLAPYETNASNPNLGTYTSAANQLSTDLNDFGIAVGSIRTAITGLSGETGISEEDQQIAINLAKNVHDFFKSLKPYTYAKLNQNTYFTAPEQLSTDMGSFGTAIGTFKENIGKLTKEYSTLESDTTSAINIASQVHTFFAGLTAEYDELAKGDPTYTQFEQKVTDLTNNQLDGLSQAIAGYKTRLSGISESTLEEDTTKALTVVGQVSKFLVEANGLSIPSNRNPIQKIFGTQNKVEAMFEDMGILGQTMLDASGKLKGLSGEESTFSTDFEAAMGAVTVMAHFLDEVSGLNIEKSAAPVFEIFSQKTGQDTIFDSIVTLAGRLKQSKESFEDLDEKGFSTGFAAAMRALNAMATFMDRVGQIRKAGHLGGDADFNAVLFPIKNLSDTIAEFSVVAASTDMAAFSYVVTTVATGLTNITTSMASFAELAGGDTLAGMITSTLTAFSGFSSDVSDALTDGIDGRDFSLAIAGIMDEALQAAKDRVPKFESVGKNCAVGLAMGLRSGTSDVVKASSMVAKAAVDAAQKVFDQHSPSKVFSQMGMYNDMGLAKGTRHYAYAVVSAYEDMSKEAIDTTGSMLSGLSVLITEDMDTTPTIRPVLDLDGVTAGVHRMDGLLFDRSVDVSTSTRLARSIGSGSSGDVATKSNSLGGMKWLANTMHEDFAELSDRISSMKIVMQSGALVGEIGKDMDKYLWNQMNKEMRR